MGKVVFGGEEGGGPGEGAGAVEAEDAADAGAEEFWFVCEFRVEGEVGAEAKEEGGVVGADLLQCPGAVDADGEVFVAEERGEVTEDVDGGEIAALHEGEGAGAAEGAGGVVGFAEAGFQLVMAEAGEEERGGLVLEGGEGAGEFEFGPALGVGFDGVGSERWEEAGEGPGEIFGEAGELVECGDFGGAADDEVVAMGEEAAEVGLGFGGGEGREGVDGGEVGVEGAGRGCGFQSGRHSGLLEI